MGQSDNAATQPTACQPPEKGLDRTTTSGSEERDFLSNDRRGYGSPKGTSATGRRAEDEGEITMKASVILAAVIFSTSAFAQTASPKVGTKPLVQVKPKEPMGCKLVGTVKGIKLWAGDCVGSELRGATPATETQSLPERATGVVPPGQKQ
jgi:hypothetical protein